MFQRITHIFAPFDIQKYLLYACFEKFASRMNICNLLIFLIYLNYAIPPLDVSIFSSTFSRRGNGESMHSVDIYDRTNIMCATILSSIFLSFKFEKICSPKPSSIFCMGENKFTLRLH